MKNVVKEARKEMGLTREELADKVGVSPACLGNMEKGDFSTISAKSAAAVAAALNVSVEQMLSNTEKASIEVDMEQVKKLLKIDIELSGWVTREARKLCESLMFAESSPRENLDLGEESIIPALKKGKALMWDILGDLDVLQEILGFRR